MQALFRVWLVVVKTFHHLKVIRIQQTSKLLLYSDEVGQSCLWDWSLSFVQMWLLSMKNLQHIEAGTSGQTYIQVTPQAQRGQRGVGARGSEVKAATLAPASQSLSCTHQDIVDKYTCREGWGGIWHRIEPQSHSLEEHQPLWSGTTTVARSAH